MQLQNFINSIDYSITGRCFFSALLLLVFSLDFLQLTKFVWVFFFNMWHCE